MPEWIYMPKLGVNMTEGVILDWLVNEGDSIEKEQPLLEIETDKAVQEVESPVSGILAKIVYPIGETVPCTYVIAIITAEGEELPDEIPLMDEAGAVPVASFNTTMGESPSPTKPEPISDAPKKSIRISPAARKMAQDLGIDYTQLAGTGSNERIQKADIIAAAEAQKSTPAPLPASVPVTGAATPLAGVRSLIAERMLQSTRETAQVTLVTEVDATLFVAWREQLRQGYLENATHIGYNELLIMITSYALSRDFSYMNIALHDNSIHTLEEVNIGIAVDTERGLLVPVIKQADQKNLLAIHNELVRLVEAAQSGSINPDDLAGGTFTITNLGMFEIDAFTPIINLPEAAILGVGQITPKPVVVGGQVAIQKRMTLSLAFDHRLVDGAPAARFLQRIKHLIEVPLELHTIQHPVKKD